MSKARDLANFVSGTNSAITTTQIDDDAVTNAKIANESITINGSAVNLGGSVTVGETKPTITGISPSVITNAQTSITITGTNFVSAPIVEAISSTGVITQADSVTFTSSTSIAAQFTLATDGTYFIRVENNDGNAVRSSNAILTVSDAPSWTTAAGSSVSYTVAATNATSFSKISGSFPGGVSLNTTTGVISGTESGATSETTYNFTIRATDAEGQTADRAFSITITVGINNSGGFC